MKLYIKFQSDEHIIIETQSEEEASSLLRSIHGAMATGTGVFITDGIAVFRGKDVLFAKVMR